MGSHQHDAVDQFHLQHETGSGVGLVDSMASYKCHREGPLQSSQLV